MFDRDNNHISNQTTARRDTRKLTEDQTRKAKELRDQGRTFDEIDEILVVADGTTLAANGLWRASTSDSGNAVLNVDPEDRDRFRADHCLPGEAIRSGFKRHLCEHVYYRAWAQATGCPPFSGLSLEPAGFS
jgi:hypothetical protein